MCGLTAGNLLQGLERSRGIQIRAAAITVWPQVEVEDGEGLSANVRSQTLQSGQVLVHNFLRAEPALAHCMLLEAAHELGEHTADPELGQKVVSGDVARERAGDAAQEAGEVSHPNKEISNLSTSLTHYGSDFTVDLNEFSFNCR